MLKMMGNIFIILALVIFIFLWKESADTNSKQKEMVSQIETLAQGDRNEKTQPAAEQQMPVVQGEQVLGILTIPKINLKVAMVEGATLKNIKHAVGHLEGSGLLGVTNNNFVILGHNSYTTGEFFNRLDELKNGDEIQIETPKKTYHYTVFKRQIIKPTQIEVIQPVKDLSMVTLITCYPHYSNKKRLVVYTRQS